MSLSPLLCNSCVIPVVPKATETREDESSEEEESGRYPALFRGGKKRLKVRSFSELKLVEMFVTFV